MDIFDPKFCLFNGNDELKQQWLDGLKEHGHATTPDYFVISMKTVAKPEEDTVFLLKPLYEAKNPTFHVLANGADNRTIGTFSFSVKEDKPEAEIKFQGQDLEQQDIQHMANVLIKECMTQLSTLL